LSQRQIARYQRDGYLVLPRVLTDREVATFLLREPRIPAWSKAPQPLTRHKVEPHWRWLVTHRGTAGIVAQLLYGIPCVVQSTYLPKQPLVPGAVARTGIGFHRDNFYIRSEPQTLLACWIALCDTDAENGGLCVVPRSHLEEPHLRTNPAWRCKGFQITHRLRDRSGREWTSRLNAAQFDGIDPMDVVQLTVPRGGAVFFDGNLIHGSYANCSPTRERLAAAVHYVKNRSWVFRVDLQDTMPVKAS
jgi:ectoine hydroxylase-related dioxygenase (phytanoyl-CoA dioxygenase family)